MENLCRWWLFEFLEGTHWACPIGRETPVMLVRMWIDGDVKHVRFCSLTLDMSIIESLMKDDPCTQVAFQEDTMWLVQCVIKFVSRFLVSKDIRGCPCSVMVKALDCGIVVREFELQSRHYIHFRTNTLGEGMNLLILPSMSWIVPLLF